MYIGASHAWQYPSLHACTTHEDARMHQLSEAHQTQCLYLTCASCLFACNYGQAKVTPHLSGSSWLDSEVV